MNIYHQSPVALRDARRTTEEGEDEEEEEKEEKEEELEPEKSKKETLCLVL